MKRNISPLLILPLVLHLTTVDAYAEKICIKNGSRNRIARKVVASSAPCPRGFTLIVDTIALVGPQGAQGIQGVQGAQGLQGIQGAQGVQGTDGAIQVFGDGSDGNVTFSASTTLANSSPQFVDVTINSGVTLSVLPGSTIRCTGNFINNGTISVISVFNGGAADLGSANLLSPAVSYPAPGIAYGSPGTGTYGTSAGSLFGGPGAVGLGAIAGAIPILHPSARGGGGGAGSLNGGVGGNGGGAIRILCGNDITLALGSAINADAGTAFSGGGGGGGGLVVLGAGHLITVAGSISANGSVGSNSTTFSGSGGGGGGGVVQLIAPSINNTGTVSVTGAIGGSAAGAGTVNNTPRMAGGGGGASGGSSGPGGNVNVNGSTTAGQAGSAGVVSSTLASPVSAVL